MNQNYPDLEYIVIDGGSTDGSQRIIERYEARLAYWESQKDNGQSEAINKGLRRATGEVIGWLNSDDTLAPGALDRIAVGYIKNPEADLLYGHTCLIDQQDRVRHRLVAVPANSTDLIKYNRNVFSQPGTTWRRRLQQRVGLLDESLHFLMDCDFWIRAALLGCIRPLRVHLGNLRIHPASKSIRERNHFFVERQELDRRYGVEYRTGLRHDLFKLRKRLRVLARPANLVFLAGLAD